MYDCINLSSTQSRDDITPAPAPPCNLLIQGSCATVRRDRSQSSNKALFTKPLPRTSNIFKLRLYLQTFLLNPTDRRVAGNKYKPSTETTPTFVSSLATKLGLYSGTPHKTQCPDSASAYTGRPLQKWFCSVGIRLSPKRGNTLVNRGSIYCWKLNCCNYNVSPSKPERPESQHAKRRAA